MRRPTVSQPASAASIRPGSSSSRPRADKAQRGGLARRDADAVTGDLANAGEGADARVVASAAGAADGDDKIGAFIVERGVQRGGVRNSAPALGIDGAGNERGDSANDVTRAGPHHAHARLAHQHALDAERGEQRDVDPA